MLSKLVFQKHFKDQNQRQSIQNKQQYLDICEGLLTDLQNLSQKPILNNGINSLSVQTYLSQNQSQQQLDLLKDGLEINFNEQQGSNQIYDDIYSNLRENIQKYEKQLELAECEEEIQAINNIIYSIMKQQLFLKKKQNINNQKKPIEQNSFNLSTSSQSQISQNMANMDKFRHLDDHYEIKKKILLKQAQALQNDKYQKLKDVQMNRVTKNRQQSLTNNKIHSKQPEKQTLIIPQINKITKKPALQNVLYPLFIPYLREKLQSRKTKTKNELLFLAYCPKQYLKEIQRIIQFIQNSNQKNLKERANFNFKLPKLIR